jgi:transposase
MDKLCSQQATSWQEGRRLRAWELYQSGWTQCSIAKALGVTRVAVCQWINRAKSKGPQSLLHRKQTGAPPKLSPEKRLRLLQLLSLGSEAFGFRGEVWTEPRIVEVVRREFGVSYHPSQIGRILKQCHWSRQKPVRRARQRDEEAIKKWKEEQRPELKKPVKRGEWLSLSMRVAAIFTCGGSHFCSGR